MYSALASLESEDSWPSTLQPRTGVNLDDSRSRRALEGCGEHTRGSRRTGFTGLPPPPPIGPKCRRGLPLSPSLESCPSRPRTAREKARKVRPQFLSLRQIAEDSAVVESVQSRPEHRTCTAEVAFGAAARQNANDGPLSTPNPADPEPGSCFQPGCFPVESLKVTSNVITSS